MAQREIGKTRRESGFRIERRIGFAVRRLMRAFGSMSKRDMDGAIMRDLERTERIRRNLVAVEGEAVHDEPAAA